MRKIIAFLAHINRAVCDFNSQDEYDRNKEIDHEDIFDKPANLLANQLCPNGDCRMG